METIEITVLHYFNHPVLYPFMTESLFEVLNDAFQHGEEKAVIPLHEYENMITQYFETLKN